jgi:FkbM family methyltransferase
VTDTPVVVFAHARPHHLVRVLDSLRAAGVPSLHVHIDGPRDDTEATATARVREIVDGISWAAVEVSTQRENRGVPRQVVGAATTIFEQHEGAIFVEDDCVVEPAFYEVMCELLTHYRDEPRAFSLSGYGPVFDLPADYAYTHYWSPRFSTWGWATWRDRWREYSEDYAAYLRRVEDVGYDIDRLGPDLARRTRAAAAGTLRRDSWEPGWALAAAKRDGLSLWPVRSLVTNIGHDGSGRNVGVGYAHRPAPRWTEQDSLRLPPEIAEHPVVSRRALDAIDPPPTRRRPSLVGPARAGVKRALLSLRESPSARRVARRVADEITGLRAPELRGVRRLRHVPRRVPGLAYVAGRPFRYADGLSVYHQVREIFVEGLYDLSSTGGAPRILDCGGNVGTSVRRFRTRHPAADITVVEADDALCDLLRWNLDAAGDALTHVIHAAVWKHDGYVQFAEDGADAGHVAEGGGLRVPSVDVATLVGDGLDLLKLDVEGAELIVLERLAETGMLARVALIVCEVHESTAQPDTLRRTLDLLHENGLRYRVVHAYDQPGVDDRRVEVGFAAVRYAGAHALVYAWREGPEPAAANRS